MLWTREVRVLRRASFAEQAATLDELVERYRPVRIAMDQTGMGEAPTEEAKRRYGESRVEGVLFTGPAKQHMATLLTQQAEDRRLRIPVDTAIRTDLHSLRRVDDGRQRDSTSTAATATPTAPGRRRWECTPPTRAWRCSTTGQCANRIMGCRRASGGWAITRTATRGG